jgi:hypothetical protein
MDQSLLTLRAAVDRGKRGKRRSEVNIERGSLRRRFPIGTTIEA